MRKAIVAVEQTETAAAAESSGLPECGGMRVACKWFMFDVVEIESNWHELAKAQNDARLSSELMEGRAGDDWLVAGDDDPWKLTETTSHSHTITALLDIASSLLLLLLLLLPISHSPLVRTRGLPRHPDT